MVAWFGVKDEARGERKGPLDGGIEGNKRTETGGVSCERAVGLVLEDSTCWMDRLTGNVMLPLTIRGTKGKFSREPRIPSIPSAIHAVQQGRTHQFGRAFLHISALFLDYTDPSATLTQTDPCEPRGYHNQKLSRTPSPCKTHHNFRVAVRKIEWTGASLLTSSSEHL